MFIRNKLEWTNLTHKTLSEIIVSKHLVVCLDRALLLCYEMYFLELY